LIIAAIDVFGDFTFHEHESFLVGFKCWHDFKLESVRDHIGLMCMRCDNVNLSHVQCIDMKFGNLNLCMDV